MVAEAPQPQPIDGQAKVGVSETVLRKDPGLPGETSEAGAVSEGKKEH